MRRKAGTKHGTAEVRPRWERSGETGADRPPSSIFPLRSSLPSILGFLRAFADDFRQRLDRRWQGIFLVGRVEVEINAAQGPWAVALAQYDGHLFVQRDAVAQVGSAALVSLDRLLHQGTEGGRKIFRRFSQTDHMLIKHLCGLGDFF